MASPFDIALMLWRRKGVLAFLFIIGSAIGVLICVYSPRAYIAETIVLIKKPNGNFVRVGNGTEPALVHTRILTSTEVVRSALADVQVNPHDDRSLQTYVNRLTDFVRNLIGKPSPSPQSKSLLTAVRSLSTEVEPGGEIIHVRFRSGDPVTASAFLNALIFQYATRLQELAQWRDSGPISQRESELVHAYKRAYDKLTEFSAKTKLYSSSEQQLLALRRHNDLATAIFETRSAIEDKTAQLATYPEQLAKMKPLAHVLGNSDLVGPLPSGRRRNLADDDVTSSTPPLLLQRVYQDTVQTVVRIRTELAGLQKKLDQQLIEQKNIDDELNRLSLEEAEYNKLQFEVGQTKADAEAYSKWVIDQRSSSALPEIQVLQEATPPVRPVFPRPELLVPLSALLSLFLGSIALAGTHILRAAYQNAARSPRQLTVPDFLAQHRSSMMNWQPVSNKKENTLLNRVHGESA